VRERLRAVLANPRTGLALALTAAAGVALFMFAGLRIGAAADECAEALARAATAKDRAHLERVVKNPSLREELLAAPSVELGYVRPIDSEWTRVGLFVRTSTHTRQVVLQLSTEDGCLFLRDY
jgi:hypothetical protein